MNFPEVFQLTSMFVEEKGLVLEGNGGYNPESPVDGAALMSPQTNASGTMFKAIPLDNGYFQLTTLFVEERGLVLESNGGYNPDSPVNGASLMSPQRNATGTMWKVLPLDNGYFQLTTMFVEDKGLVLESNGGYNPDSPVNGASLMSPQRDATGTMWKVIPVE